ncbi:hypothetical protein NLJ89_g4152 [Agrocybe chaxingu]|uniref:Uncharacterized protein n=1 Tax=Agrocybe chaxingu TaxID=84603 RepID=A0A9W8K925_9AGAR|nr:hypothetical protein NLJ89_g4152 [Agrocybe chaxingu]
MPDLPFSVNTIIALCAVPLSLAEKSATLPHYRNMENEVKDYPNLPVIARRMASLSERKDQDLAVAVQIKKKAVNIHFYSNPRDEETSQHLKEVWEVLQDISREKNQTRDAGRTKLISLVWRYHLEVWLKDFVLAGYRGFDAHIGELLQLSEYSEYANELKILQTSVSTLVDVIKQEVHLLDVTQLLATLKAIPEVKQELKKSPKFSVIAQYLDTITSMDNRYATNADNLVTFARANNKTFSLPLRTVQAARYSEQQNPEVVSIPNSPEEWYNHLQRYFEFQGKTVEVQTSFAEEAHKYHREHNGKVIPRVHSEIGLLLSLYEDNEFKDSDGPTCIATPGCPSWASLACFQMVREFDPFVKSPPGLYIPNFLPGMREASSEGREFTFPWSLPSGLSERLHGLVLGGLIKELNSRLVRYGVIKEVPKGRQ